MLRLVPRNPRILIYSHDSFGLGHLRRCRAIAHGLVGAWSELTVLILSGSPIIGSFDFRSRVDFVRIPGVIKLRNGEYTSLSLHLDTEHTLQIRASIIEHTAEVFAPDIFIVDKEPLGLRGEVRPTLELLRDQGTHLVLGLRDVLDDADALHEEWLRKDSYPALEEFYDDVWVYGVKSVHDPLDGLAVSDCVRDRTRYTGYLQRSAPQDIHSVEPIPFDEGSYLLVTPGGGGDGIELVDWVMRAYETAGHDLMPAVIVLGPFMDPEHQAAFLARAEGMSNIHMLRFTPHIEPLMIGAAGIVGMGGYNIFCEILSFDRPTLLVPRVIPRREQSIRASRAAEAGLLTVLPIDHRETVSLMVDALKRLPRQAPPSSAGLHGLMGGLDAIIDRVGDVLSDRAAKLRPQDQQVHSG
ncbi:MAG: hypothetical protein AAFX39_01865 [Pseudomonadota bacterium]